MRNLFFVLLLVQFWGLVVHADPIRVCALLPLTGTGADQADWIRRGLEVGKVELGQKGIDLELSYEDTKGDPKEALSAYKKAVLERSPMAIVTWGSGVAMVLSPEVNRDKVIQMGVATATSAYTSVGDYTFRIHHSSVSEGEFLAESARTPDAKTGLLYINNEYGNQIAKAFLAKRPGIIFNESFEPGTTDFRSLIAHGKLKDLQGLVVIPYPAEGAGLLKQLKELAVGGQITAAGALYGGKNFFSLVGNAAEGARLAMPLISDHPRWRSFLEMYEKQFSEKLQPGNVYPPRAFDAAIVLGQAGAACRGDATCVKDKLFQVKDFDGAIGKISFDEAGDVSYPLALYRVTGQTFVLDSAAN